jgi:hypothetical protein
MPTPMVAIGQIWTRGDATVLVTDVDRDTVTVNEVVDGDMTTAYHRVTCPSGQPVDGWTYSMQAPTLKCLDQAAATAAVAYLASKGVTVYAAGRHVIAPMTPTSIIRFAEEAFENDWAHDEDCARMIGHLG